MYHAYYYEWRSLETVGIVILSVSGSVRGSVSLRVRESVRPRRVRGGEGREGRGRGIRLGHAHTPLTLFSHSRSHFSAVKHSKKCERECEGECER